MEGSESDIKLLQFETRIHSFESTIQIFLYVYCEMYHKAKY